MAASKVPSAVNVPMWSSYDTVSANSTPVQSSSCQPDPDRDDPDRDSRGVWSPDDESGAAVPEDRCAEAAVAERGSVGVGHDE